VYFNLLTGSVVEPVTLAEAKAFLNIVDTNSTDDTHPDDKIIESLIKAAREEWENDTGVVCVSSTWQLFFKDIPERMRLFVSKAPVGGISSIKYYPIVGDGETPELTELDKSCYEWVPGKPGQVHFFSNADLPSVDDNMDYPWVIEFVAGYSVANGRAATPESIKLAIKQLIVDRYENRQAVVTGTQVNVVPGVYTAIVEQWKLRNF
jgi:uncharacterized phiE125 gp8 family phage protein